MVSQVQLLDDRQKRRGLRAIMQQKAMQQILDERPGKQAPSYQCGLRYRREQCCVPRPGAEGSDHWHIANKRAHEEAISCGLAISPHRDGHFLIHRCCGPSMPACPLPIPCPHIVPEEADRYMGVGTTARRRSNRTPQRCRCKAPPISC
jgi:hypothetical protein